MNDLGVRIKSIREDKKLTKSELARLIGVSPAYITMLENGTKKNPSTDILKKIAGALEVSTDDLTGKKRTKMDAITLLNRMNNSNMSEVEMAKSILFDSGFFKSNTFESSSTEEKNKIINNLLENNSLNLKIQNYIDNFDSFTKEDLIEINYALNDYGKEILNKFIKEYHDEDIRIFSRRFLETYALLQLTTKTNEKANEVIESYKTKLNEINNILKSDE